MSILLTGATGFLGKELYRGLQSKGLPVVGMSRHGPDVIGDITVSGLGIPSYKYSTIIHSAASLSFSQKDRESTFRINADGTKNVCRWALDNKVNTLIYISTAYTCGDFKGSWGEHDFYRGQSFHNPYEESKLKGEVYVREVSNFLNTIIIRPGIIVGRSDNGCSSSFEGFYKPVKAIARVMMLMEKRLKLPKREMMESTLRLPKLHLPLAIKGNPDSTLNLVPVDWVVDRIISLIYSDSGTYHLTDPLPLTNREICEGINEALGITGPHFDKEARLLQPHDRIYNKMVKDFLPYLQNEPKFISSVDSSLLVTKDKKRGIVNMVKYWREHEQVIP